ncbi:cAMP-binding domain of CRP or a regulatory subunit of cAMP-dependent protein kinases [Catalinimonas alkaloidigena]|uniref:cAMP-binding domain of CRP or a regulatory subunit of cAMP-dependent protein kinases n=1 Tax=Catalinimonas alkaloidigena TaxID=1075417 RepID=A0A1G8WC26_9BACT|nr:response regulator [Catalinimonas alkaloidigena]SDJ75325.1 cAMP-binding domain of CRP or a regulatory subunit of cAMP-dependent protein kinases [Catalinimonas alkaloidigena]
MTTLLLIEDNLEIRENAAEILELAGYRVLTAENGKVGVTLARQERPDLIICDIMMPELDGYGVLRMLHQQEELAHIPFIFLTAKAEREDFRKGMTLGADDYLTKPFDDNELLEAVDVRLKKSRVHQRDYPNSLQGLHQLLEDAGTIHELKDLPQQYKLRKYPKKRPVFLEGNSAQSLYFVQEGKVKTFKSNEDGREYITGMYGPGDFFGYQALFEEGAYSETAIVMEDAEIASIPKTDFLALLYGNQAVSLKFIKMLSHNLMEREEQLLRMAYHSVRQRTAQALLSLHEQADAEGFRISREDLASLVGTAKETVIRTLSDFKDEGLVVVAGSRIQVKNTQKLERIVRM